jgi:predicted NAD/FAD-binding protein
MNIAIVGTGISGLVCGHLLHEEHELTLYEAGDHVGGHTITTRVAADGAEHWVDAGFIVYNEVNYPNFVRLLDRLGVATQPTSMSFSVRDDAAGLEYCGTSLDTLFAQRRNLVRPSFLRMVADIVRFNRDGRALLSGNGSRPTLRQFLDAGGYRRELVEQYLVPMTAAIWSTSPERILDSPADFLLRFLENHGLLSLGDRPAWRVVRGGSRRYVEALIRPFRDRIRLRTPVRALRRDAAGVEVVTAGGQRARFDEVIVAAHSDQALAMLAEPTAAEREVLGAIPYQANRALLHTDESVLPRRKRARASWNFHRPVDGNGHLTVTYDMCRLQSLDARPRFCVSLNMDERIDARRVMRSFDFAHPLFTPAAVAAQERHAEISGADRIHYCGAYWRNGFHEDGVVSALEVGRRLGCEL